jgi:acetyl esterase
MMSKIESMQPRPLQSLNPDEARIEDLRTSLPFLSVPEPVKKIENRILVEDGNRIPSRLYWPNDELSKGNEDYHGMLIYFHGGGWVVGQLDQFDEVCSKLANCSGAIVISVDYRLAPENKFLAAIDDCYSATKWAEKNAKKFDRWR